MEPGDIALMLFPYGDGQADKVHPALVLEVEEHVIYVAYGTSQRVTEAAAIDTAVAISDPADVQASGLLRPTAFHLEKRARFPKNKVLRRLGAIPHHKYRQLYRAAVKVGLLSR